MKREYKLILKTVKDPDFQHCLIKLLLECWNSDNPHFSGLMPHRYDDSSRYCGYCGRPKNWKAMHPGVTASNILYSDESAA